LPVLILFFTAGALVSAEENAIPTRIILNLTANPAQEIAVTWRTGPGVEQSRVEIMPATPKSPGSLNKDSPDPYKDVKAVNAVSETVNTGKNKTVLHHSVILKNLVPDTLYQYRVGNGKTWSEWCHFRTASTGEKPFTFIFLGDPQNDIKSFCSRAFRSAYSAAPDARFILIAGDLVSIPWLDNWWGELFYAAGWMARQVPVIVVPGNHSYFRGNGVWRYTANKPHPLWYAHLTLPGNGPKGLEETAYYIDYQGVRLIVLNSNEKQEEQALWLEPVLANNKNKWTIVAIHHPFYSTGKDRDYPRLREIFLPVFEKYPVDLVLQGHDHSYGRTFKLRNGDIVKDRQKGTVFVVTVSGPKFYEVNEEHRHLMRKMDTDVQLFQVITVEENVLTYEARTVTDQRYDFFKLKKK
jgi:3',5'-cyclic AMP phosphodiesterase CpdA